ncbi:MAG: 16S rRNA (cytosine(967)-C(5))-methyltransferase [Hydrogenophilales bacterium 16-64-46]|nr:MAG: 16S rRNA (cytosine(967)-C(5))-methyltransferase [Hydrogenophilales bacterium 12-64-13]OYZ06793.1 MAG: 16S rRNA (cytosine(967)-C(5))-methyltransferase [Hydrogenophilales bacterium 16-64-46]OZA39500.1 MAG: 16S rRNA (cytosine(967)-C(5))-methyltransferase [Hydrogenophilales bacterium 17-64-34]HQS99808.1 16S rRNA (cytosine(967)-C(5))-methyltransferase RsmB [Thiobacillus sp.]
MRTLQICAAATVAATLAGAALHQTLPAALAGIDAPADRGAVQDWVYGVLRWRGRLDFWLDRLLDKPLTDPALGELLRISLYQLAFTRAKPFVVVNEAVAAAGTGWRRGLANAVLRNFQRRRSELDAAALQDEGARWSHPAWWVARLRRDHPHEWQAILDASLAHPPFTLRVNARHGSVADTLAELAAAGFDARQTGPDAVTLERAVAVARLPGFAEGRVSVQDAGAQWAARLLDPQAGMRVLDACAAPGGKTGHLLEYACDLDLTALDADPARLVRVRENLDRLGLAATLLAGDAAQPAGWWDGCAYDRILADVPCSASGVVRRNPDIKWLRRPEDLAGFARQQAAILDALWPLLAPGGTLLYATCSIFREENDDQVAAFLARHPGRAERRSLPEPLTDGSLLPHAEHDGFYYALLAKPV